MISRLRLNLVSAALTIKEMEFSERLSEAAREIDHLLFYVAVLPLASSILTRAKKKYHRRQNIKASQTVQRKR
jgi:hypothetical protein